MAEWTSQAKEGEGNDMITTATGGTISEHTVDALQDIALGYYFARASVQPNEHREWGVWSRFVRLYSVMCGQQATYAKLDELWTRHQPVAEKRIQRLSAEWRAAHS